MAVRKMILLLILIVLLTGAAFAILDFDPPPEQSAVPGDSAPPFATIDLREAPVSLADYKGKGVLLNFWASWCNPCVNELPLLNEAYKLTGIEMLAINVGEKPEVVQKFVDRYGLAFPIAMDMKMAIKQQYRVVGLPLTVLVNKDGKIVARHEGELTDMVDIIALMNQTK
ncbi:redoxin domain-containing protein [Paenibacillus sp. NPDC058071]|uniref:redoxin domain-containing protein n=1 Tax=Paenibacillus sp. NPDC058071 TaxID=3346326 RepID=UPI0036D7F071